MKGKKDHPPKKKPQNNIIILPYFHSTIAINNVFEGKN
jgi:hypothetical protein